MVATQWLAIVMAVYVVCKLSFRFRFSIHAHGIGLVEDELPIQRFRYDADRKFPFS
jgi:hypothetical protein